MEEDQSQRIRAGRPVAEGGAVLAKDGGRQVSTLLFPKSFLLKQTEERDLLLTGAMAPTHKAFRRLRWFKANLGYNTEPLSNLKERKELKICA